MTSSDSLKKPAAPERLSRAQKQLEKTSDQAALDIQAPMEGSQVTAPESKAEIDGPDGLDPTRFGDWERNGRCIDF